MIEIEGWLRLNGGSVRDIKRKRTGAGKTNAVRLQYVSLDSEPGAPTALGDGWRKWSELLGPREADLWWTRICRFLAASGDGTGIVRASRRVFGPRVLSSDEDFVSDVEGERVYDALLASGLGRDIGDAPAAASLPAAPTAPRPPDGARTAAPSASDPADDPRADRAADGARTAPPMPDGPAAEPRADGQSDGARTAAPSASDPARLYQVPGTKEDKDTPLPPAGAGGGGDSPSAFTPGQRAAAGVIADAIEAGDVKLEPDAAVAEAERAAVDALTAEREAKRRRDANALRDAETRLAAARAAAAEARRAQMAAAVAGLRGGSGSAMPLLERYQVSGIETGPQGDRTTLRQACDKAKRMIRGDERDRRRIAKQSVRDVEFHVREISVNRTDPRKSRAVELLAKPRDEAWMRAAQELLEQPQRRLVALA